LTASYLVVSIKLAEAKVEGENLVPDIGHLRGEGSCWCNRLLSLSLYRRVVGVCFLGKGASNDS
jgi:hypothetical protein